MSNCRVCRKEFKDGVGRYQDHMLFKEEGITEAICLECALNNPDEHHKEFKKLTKGLNFANVFKPRAEE